MPLWILFLTIFCAQNSLATESILDTHKGLVVEALLARVGREPVMLSDLIRYNEVENVMICAELRKSYDVQPTQVFNIILSRYIEEELMFLEARNKKMQAGTLLPGAVSKIQKKKDCMKEWQSLGKRFAILWATPKRPHEGEAMLIRELEKRLLIDQFEVTEMKAERSLWIREEKVKIPLKLYLD